MFSLKICLNPARKIRSCGSVLLLTTICAIAQIASNSVQAATIYVDGQISSTSCNNYDPTSRGCGGGTERAFRTFAAAATAATPGTTVVFRAGTFNERLRPAASGTETEPITFKNFGTEQVFFNSSPGMDISDRSYLIIEGLRVENTTWLEARNSHHNILRKCVFKHNPNGGTTGNVRFISSHYNQILENHIEDGNDNLLLIDSNHNLVQGNTIIEGGHSLFGIRCGDFNVIRNNYFSNTQQKIGEVYDCGADTSAVPNSFNSTGYNVIENNVFDGTDASSSTSDGNGIQYSGQFGIIRNNVFTRCNVGLGMQVYSDEALHNKTNRVYHNVFYLNRGPGVALRANNVANIFLNNILYKNEGLLPSVDAVSPGQMAFRSSTGSGTAFHHNNFYYQAAGNRVIEEEFGSGATISEFSSENPGVLVGSLEVEPQFENPAERRFALQSSSPLIDRGTFLTKSRSAGTGDTLPVDDAFPFSDGFDVPGIPGDTIQLQNSKATARVVQVDHANRTLKLDRSITWTNGEGIALQFSGSAPDVGLFEPIGGSRPSAPTGVRIANQ